MVTAINATAKTITDCNIALVNSESAPSARRRDSTRRRLCKIHFFLLAEGSLS